MIVPTRIGPSESGSSSLRVPARVIPNVLVPDELEDDIRWPAGIAAAVVVLVTFLVDLLVPALQLPNELRDLALTVHYGQPMIGVSGIRSGSWPRWLSHSAVWRLVPWGFARRDLET